MSDKMQFKHIYTTVQKFGLNTIFKISSLHKDALNWSNVPLKIFTLLEKNHINAF